MEAAEKATVVREMATATAAEEGKDGVVRVTEVAMEVTVTVAGMEAEVTVAEATAEATAEGVRSKTYRSTSN